MEHTVDISVNTSAVIETIKSWLSVIGKRTDGTQDPPYSKVTLSSVELAVLKGMVESAARTVATAISRFVRNFTISEISIDFKVVNTRWAYPEGDNFDAILTNDISTFCASSAAGEYFAMYYSDFAQKNYEVAQAKMESIMRLLYFKTPPQNSAKSMADISGTII